MFDRIIFIIILSLFFLVPFSVVYADDNDHYQDLSIYKLIPSDTTNFYRYVTEFNPAETAQWFTTREAACSNLFLISFPYLSTQTAAPASWAIEVTKCAITVKNTNSGSFVVKRAYTLSTKSQSINCDINADSTFIQFYVKGVTTIPKTKACLSSCEYHYKAESGGGSPTATPTKSSGSQVDDITRFAIPSAKMTGSACELITCPVTDPLCANTDPPDEPPDDDDNGGGGECTQAEKDANGGQCPTSGGGGECTQAEKDANGGQCPTSGGGGGECTQAQKDANGGQCPTSGGGTCTSSPINQKICDFIDWFKTPASPSNENTKVDIKNQTTADVGLSPEQFDTNRVSFGAYCPPPAVETLSFMGESVTIEVSYQPVCDFLSFIRYIVIAAGAFAAAYILSGVRS